MFTSRSSLSSIIFASAAASALGAVLWWVSAAPADARSLSRELRVCQTPDHARALDACGSVIARPERASVAQIETAYLTRARLHWRRGARSEALSDLERAAALNPANARTWLYLGEARLGGLETQLSLEAFTRAEALAGADPTLAGRALVGIGESHRRAGRLDAAGEAFEQAIWRSDDGGVRASAYLGKGKVLVDRGDLDGAIAALLAASRHEHAASEISWTLGEALAARSRALSGAAYEDDYEAALRAFRGVLVGAPAGEAASAQARARAHVAIGALLLERHRRFGEARLLSEAVASFDQAIGLDPGHVEALAGRAEARARDPLQRAAALRDLDAALRLSPHEARLYRTRGDIHLAAGDEAAAMRDYDTALQRGAERAHELYQLRGALYLTIGDFGRARQSFDRALAVAEADPALIGSQRTGAVAEALLGRAEATWRMLDAPGVNLRAMALEAVADADRAAEQAPEAARYQVGRCLARVAAGGHWQAARQICRDAVDLARAAGGQDLAEAWAARGLFELKMALAGPVSGRARSEYLSAAEQSFSAASLHADNDARPLALYGRAVAMQCLARPNEAARFMSEALSADRGVAARFEIYRMPRCSA